MFLRSLFGYLFLRRPFAFAGLGLGAHQVVVVNELIAVVDEQVGGGVLDPHVK